MIKNIFKEIIIILLLITVILVILSVLLYDYNPSNKVLPNKKEYTVPDNIKQELQEANEKDETIGVEGKVYTVEGTDLNRYKKSNTYNPSKQNPYANTITGANATLPDGNGNSGSGSTSNNGGNAQGNTNTTNNNVTPGSKTGLK